MAMSDTKAVPRAWLKVMSAFVVAWLLATAWGSLVQTQFNLQALVGLGVEIPLSVRLVTSVQDVVGFGPTYAAVLLAAWLPAFGVAIGLARVRPAWRAWLLPLSAGVGLTAAVRIIDALAPMPVFIDATRGLGGLLAMVAGCVLAGAWFERRTRSPQSV